MTPPPLILVPEDHDPPWALGEIVQLSGRTYRARVTRVFPSGAVEVTPLEVGE